MIVVGNYNLSGTNKFVSHALTPNEEKTLCGLTVSKLRGDWQETGGSDFSCLLCKKKYDGTMLIRYIEGASNTASTGQRHAAPNRGASE